MAAVLLLLIFISFLVYSNTQTHLIVQYETSYLLRFHYSMKSEKEWEVYEQSGP